MQIRTSLLNLWHHLRHAATHAGITLVAVSVALALPRAASYILFNWWPKIREDAQMLLLTEVGFATVLVLLLNLLKLTWDYRAKARMAAVASLVYAHEEQVPGAAKGRPPLPPLWKRDLAIMAVTGYGTFAADDSLFKDIVDDCYEIRVMLMNPYGSGALAYASVHADPAATLAELRREVAASIAALRQLQGKGKKVALKFYDEPPFWKLVFTGEYAWVRSCHNSRDGGKCPEYIFALHADNPSRGFFPAFYTYFLNRWNDSVHPDYAFETDELVFRDSQGTELRREPYAGELSAAPLERADAPHDDWGNSLLHTRPPILQQ